MFREGIEAVVFLAGVSTTESVTAIPIAAVVGVICGLACGFMLSFTYASPPPPSSLLEDIVVPIGLQVPSRRNGSGNFGESA